MDTERLNRWITLGANIAVLVGIALIVLELNQNREMMRASTRNEISQGELTLLGSMASNRELLETLLKAGNNEELSDAELFLVTVHSESVFRLWQNVHYQGRNGLYDEEEFKKHIDTMRSVLGDSPWLVYYWCDNSAIYPTVFAAEIDGLTPDGSCPH
ncbi:MAG: hypothetical protein ACYSU4_02305 [Planctomycetota bacterium]|jgi:hypothetical protein